MIPASRVHGALLSALQESGVDFVDTYPDFQADAMHPTSPLTLIDGHLNVNGRNILIRSLVNGLEKTKPWMQSRY